MSRSFWRAARPLMRWSHGAQHILLGLLALITLVAALWANLQLWPVEYLGFDADLAAGMVTTVTPGSTASAAGLQAGDQLVTIYGRPVEQVVYWWNLRQLIDQSGAAIPVSVDRAGNQLSLLLPRRPPEPSLQLSKLVFMVLAAVCWTTGALLGLGRRHEVNGSRSVAAFWLLLAGVLGCYKFAASLSLPLLALLSWFMLAILPPLAVWIHVWFPARAVTTQRSQHARRALVISWSTLNLLLLVSWALWKPELATAVLFAWPAIVVAFVSAFIATGLVLVEAYRRVSTPHVRRQLRLIAAACLVTANVWLIVRVIPLFLGIPAPLPDAVIDMVPVIIPLAYLLSGTASNLFTLDRLATRLVSELIVLAAIAFIFGAAVMFVARGQAELIIWCALTIGLLLRPTSAWLRQLRTGQFDLDRSYAPLHQTRHQLASSLDLQVLMTAFQEGIQTTFQRAPFALYIADQHEQHGFVLARQDGLPDLPASLPIGTLLERLGRGDAIIEARTLYPMLAAASLSAAEERAICHQGVALWCVMRQAQGDILALALVGTAGNLEPYRAADRRELQGVLDAAAMAFANSAAYERLRHTEAARRHLFDAMRQVQDHTAAGIARELHDEIINIYVQHNITALQRLLTASHESRTRSELELVLASEQGISDALRIICERLHPTGLDDPFGLIGVLRGQVERTRATWPGQCELCVTGNPVPIEPPTQLEIFRIAREALANAVKHAAAATITVHLRYADAPEGVVTLIVEDDGRRNSPVQLKAGHWGIRNMYESARVAGGALSFESKLGGGTRVIVQFAAMLTSAGYQSLSGLTTEAIPTRS